MALASKDPGPFLGIAIFATVAVGAAWFTHRQAPERPKTPKVTGYEAECPYCTKKISVLSPTKEKMQEDGKPERCATCSNFYCISKDGTRVEKAAVGVVVSLTTPD